MGGEGGELRTWLVVMVMVGMVMEDVWWLTYSTSSESDVITDTTITTITTHRSPSPSPLSHRLHHQSHLSLPPHTPQHSKA